MRRIPILAALAAVFLAACSREEPETVFRTAEADFSDIRTRSLLTGSDIETKKTEITLAAYGEDGTLATSGHFTTNLKSMTGI